MNRSIIVTCTLLLFAISSSIVSSPVVSSPVANGQDYNHQSFAGRENVEASVYGRPPDVAVASEPTKKSSFPKLLISNNSDGEPVTASESKNQFAAPLVTVTSSLAVVLGLFAALVWVSRKYGSKTMGGAIPNEVIQTLGTTPIDPRTRITMIRLGSRILVVAQTASGITPISEITDPEEVRNLTAHCIGDSKAKFTDTLKSIEREPAGDGFLGQPAAAPAPRTRGSLFTTA
ncbi:Flagellar biosynthesis protein, FliO [Rubripirellula obstinata]|uniref:Flagellar biosynthesis protein, FliO n=1 Tax=Rubripirellula obstinata TaxID=406547 RepID=A0A5B1CJ70_9BACT|nr:flagellar biosynthetic protein FliO [Rubripirellula obstinata]KAA1260311.1 Flagellar biosynthesis protein, FliO [Rubripirellula obstinata]